TFISSTQLTAAISAGDVQALGTASVSVSNPVTLSNQPVPSSNVDFFQITPTTSASLSRTDYPTGTNSNGLIAADFDGDGKLDLAIANSGDNTVTIMLGNGDGTFQAQKDYAAGPTGVKDASDIALGDFNGDGKLDLAVTNPSTDQVSILLGQGDGTFQAPTGYSTGASGSHPIAVSAADFNGDGKLDLAVTTLNTRNIAILIGNGDGTFQNQVSYPTTTAVPIGP